MKNGKKIILVLLELQTAEVIGTACGQCLSKMENTLNYGFLHYLQLQASTTSLGISLTYIRRED